MAGIDFDNFTPVPNQEIEALCRNRQVPVKVRVRWAIIRMILGFDRNRQNRAAAISYTTLAKRTCADSRTVKRVVKGLEGKDGISVHRGCGRGHRNIYSIDINHFGEQE